MVSTRKEKQSNRKLLSQLNDFDQFIIIGNTVSKRQENATVNEGTGDQDLTGGTSDNQLQTNEIKVNVKTLERCFNDRIDREMRDFVDTVEDRIQNASLTAGDSIAARKLELAITSITGSLDEMPPMLRLIQNVGNI